MRKDDDEEGLGEREEEEGEEERGNKMNKENG